MNQTAKTILVVDDERDVLLMLEKGLAAEGYHVLTADNGRDALTLARVKKPHAIVLDVMLPDLDGGIVANELADNEATGDIPIIFLTALISKQEEKRYGQMVGSHPTLAKPYEIADLVQMLERCMAMSVG